MSAINLFSIKRFLKIKFINDKFNLITFKVRIIKIDRITIGSRKMTDKMHRSDTIIKSSMFNVKLNEKLRKNMLNRLFKIINNKLSLF